VKVTIVGGGMAGLGCLAALSGVEDAQVTLLEATRVLGGRVRSKTALGALAWDHGASYFSARDDASPFARLLRDAEAAGAVEPWTRDDAEAPASDEPSTDDPRAAPPLVGVVPVKPRAPPGPAGASSDPGDVVLDVDAFEAWTSRRKKLWVGTPSMASLPAFVADSVARASRPEASWVGDNPTAGVPEVLCGAYVDRVVALRPESGFAPHPHTTAKRRWGMMLRCREGGHMWYKPWECDVLVLATNAPACASLLRNVAVARDDPLGVSIDAPAIDRAANRAAKTRGAACWSLTAAFDASLNLPFAGAKIVDPEDRSGIAWIANNSSKPGRPKPSEGKGAASAGWGYRWAEVGRAPVAGEGECWVVNAGPRWSAERRGLDPRDAAEELCEAFLRLVDREGVAAPVHVKATKWNHAFPLPPEEEEEGEEGDGGDGKGGGGGARDAGGVVWEPSVALGACGDWTSGPRAGDAYDAGVAMGEAVKEHLRAMKER
jgi:predicted NAD/FAD-dependent oxidoreductase